jgi:membrane associated rhomboid family serine protease
MSLAAKEGSARMHRTKGIILLNVSALVGCAVWWLVAPPATPRRILIVASVAVIGLLNFFIFLVPRLRKPPGAPRKPDSFRSNVILIIVLAFLLIQILVRLGYLKY